MNSGVLRMWISERLLTPGPRAKSQGGPRTFDRKTIFKAALMAELRKHGVGLSACEKWANKFMKAASMVRFDRDDEALRMPLYYVIKPDSSTVFSISLTDTSQSLYDFVTKHGPTILIVDILGLIKSTDAILNAYGPADVSEGDGGDLT